LKTKTRNYVNSIHFETAAVYFHQKGQVVHKEVRIR